MTTAERHQKNQPCRCIDSYSPICDDCPKLEDRPGIHFKPIDYPELPKGLPRFRILWRTYNDKPANIKGDSNYHVPYIAKTEAEFDALLWPCFYPIKKAFQTLWFDLPQGLIGLKSNGDLT